MKQFLRWMMAVVAMMTTMTVGAQRIQVTDNDGNPIPMVSVLAEDGTVIGTTDIDGVLSDVKGAEVVTFTHIAYKSKKAKVGQGGRISLDDADFGLPEIVVTKKPLVYVQTYYRIYYLAQYPDDDNVYYYRAGVLNNSYNRETKKISRDEDHFSACSMGVLKTALNTVLGPFIKQLAGLNMNKVESRLKKGFDKVNLEFVPNGPGRQLIKDKYGVVGSVTDNQDKGERRYSYELHKMDNHLVQATGSDKKKAKAEKRDGKKKNRQDQNYMVYRIDEEGNYSPEDFVMLQHLTSYDRVSGDDLVPTNMLLQVFTVERSYVTKEELKQIKKENKMKMTYRNLVEFERRNKIPALPEVFLKRINQFVE